MKRNIIVNKALNKEVVFWGFKSTYIYYCAGILFVSFSFTLLTSQQLGYLSILIGLGMAIGGSSIFIYYSKTYGENGYKKLMAAKDQPKSIRVNHSIKNVIWERKNI